MTTNFKLRKALFSFIFVNYQIFTMRWILSFFEISFSILNPTFFYILKTIYRVQSKTNFLMMDRVKNWKWKQNTPFWLEPNRVLFYLTHGHRPMHCTAGGWNHIIVFIYIAGPAGTQISNVLTLDCLFFFHFFLL